MTIKHAVVDRYILATPRRRDRPSCCHAGSSRKEAGCEQCGAARVLIVRGPRPTDHFTMVSNAAVRDPRLSLRARGLLVYILSHENGWSLSVDRVAVNCREGREATAKALRELKEHGYVVQTRTKLQDGKFEWSAVVTDVPAGHAIRGFPAHGNPAGGDPGDKRQKTDVEEKGSQEVPSDPPSDLPLPDRAQQLREALTEGARRSRDDPA